jgi:hypothetical protein
VAYGTTVAQIQEAENQGRTVTPSRTAKNHGTPEANPARRSSGCS